jgi:hypothetical protein
MNRAMTSINAANLFIYIITVLLLMPCIALAGQLTPSAPPAPTMHTMEEMYQKINALEQKVSVLYDNNVTFKPWANNTRYKIFDNGTLSDPNDDMVLDTQTGLIWARNANLSNGTKNWQDAMTYCDNLVLAGKDDWRLPSKDELVTLLAEPYPSTLIPDLPVGHPFVNVQSSWYLSSTGSEYTPEYAWRVNMGNGNVLTYFRTSLSYVWPVRGGQ